VFLKRTAAAAFSFALLASPCALQGQVGWPVTDLTHSGMDEPALNTLWQRLAADPHKDIKGVVILRHGKLAAEQYFNGDDKATLHDIRSATKSLTATLMGIAIDRHIIHSVDDPISTYLPGLPKDKRAITIRDLLNMRSGLDANDEDPATPGNEDRLDESTDWMKTVETVPMKTTPGERYVYCSINAFLTGAIIENATKMPLDAFAKQALFDPLGIEAFEWRHVPINRTTGQGNLRITARDAARIGELFLNDGEFKGVRVVSRDWVEKSVANQVPISFSDPFADFYGYMWYSREEIVGDGRILVHFASGNGGNKIYIIPSLDMVVAITSSAYGTNYGQRRSQDILLRILNATSPQ
jgi:CubicO group peptidase (beta-lactamase class C family)